MAKFHDTTQAEATVVHALSYLIRSAKRSHESERHHPSRTADAMDDHIRLTGERAETLRRLREEFEDVMAKPTEGGY